MTDSIYGAFATDKKAEQQGIVLNYGKAGKIKIARAGGSNQNYVKALELRFRPVRRQVQNGTVSNEMAEELLREVFADAIVLDWEGIKGRDGNPMEFNRENVVKLFTDLPDLFADVREQADKLANFLDSAVEVDAGN